MIGERTFTEVARRIYAAPLFSSRETEAILAIAPKHPAFALDRSGQA